MDVRVAIEMEREAVQRLTAALNQGPTGITSELERARIALEEAPLVLQRLKRLEWAALEVVDAEEGTEAQHDAILRLEALVRR